MLSTYRGFQEQSGVATGAFDGALRTHASHQRWRRPAQGRRTQDGIYIHPEYREAQSTGRL